MITEVVDFVASSLWRGRANRKQAAEDAALRARGVTAPAIVVSAVTRQSRSNVDGHFIKIDYTVDVHPADGGPTFRTRFAHWSERRGYQAVKGEIVGEAGRTIWVTYDPADPSQMLFEYDDSERAERLERAATEARCAEFVAAAEPLQHLRTDGLPAEAVIVQVDDLQAPFPGRQSTGMLLHLDVTSPTAGAYRATVPALINVAATDKYVVGRHLYVFHDPADPSRVLLDAERNRTLPA